MTEKQKETLRKLLNDYHDIAGLCGFYDGEGRSFEARTYDAKSDKIRKRLDRYIAALVKRAGKTK